MRKTLTQRLRLAIADNDDTPTAVRTQIRQGWAQRFGIAEPDEIDALDPQSRCAEMVQAEIERRIGTCLDRKLCRYSKIDRCRSPGDFGRRKLLAKFGGATALR